MFKEGVYLDGFVVRSVEESAELELLQSPYVYRTVRCANFQPEDSAAEAAELNGYFEKVFGRRSAIAADELERAVRNVLTSNHYPAQAVNVEVRLHATPERAVMCVVAGKLLLADHYESAILRPVAKECTAEVPVPECFTSFGRQVMNLVPLKNGEVRLVRRGGRLVSCEGFPLWGVVDNHVVSLTPWQSVESRRAQEVFRSAGVSVVEGVEVDESKLTELFFLALMSWCR
jgi:hypothetical protein